MRYSYIRAEDLRGLVLTWGGFSYPVKYADGDVDVAKEADIIKGFYEIQ